MTQRPGIGPSRNPGEPVDNADFWPSPANVSTITVTRVEYGIGRGIEGDPFRQIIELHGRDGCFMRWDPTQKRAYVSHVPTPLSEEGR